MKHFQLIASHGEISDQDNETNTFGDYQRLIVLAGRSVTTSERGEEACNATQYLLFGQKAGQAYFKAISKEEAEKHMIKTFWRNMTRSVTFTSPTP